MSDEVESTPSESAEQPTVAESAVAGESAGVSDPASAATPAADDAAAAPAPAVDTTTTPPPARPGVVIPRWVATLVGVLVVVLGSGAIGYAIGHHAGSDDHGRGEMHHAYGGGPNGQYGTGTGPMGRNGRNSPFGGQTPGGGQMPGSGQLPGGGQSTSPSSPQTVPTPSANGAFLGVSVQADSAGVRISGVASGSPADDAGLKAGDVVTAIDGKSVTTPAELVAQVQAHSPGDQVTLTYTRSGTSATAKVTLGSRADSGTRS